MKNKEPISQETFNNWYELHRQAATVEETITDRMSFVVYRTVEMFGGSIDTWYFDDAQESEIGDLFRALEGGEAFFPVLSWKKKTDIEMKFLTQDGLEWDIKYDGFPRRWLFEDFETEIRDGKLKYKEKEIKRKTELKHLSEKKKAEQEALIKSAKSKLSRAELAALKKDL